MRVLPSDQVKNVYIASIEVPPSVEDVVQGGHGTKGVPPEPPASLAEGTEKSEKSKAPRTRRSPR